MAAALDAGVPVTVLPGPSAVETALVASGLAGERYQFLGFLPRGERALATLWEELQRGRIRPSPSSRRSGCRRRCGRSRRRDPDRAVAVCRELTKRFEEVVRGTAAEVAARFVEPPKGEITLVLGAAAAAEPDVGGGGRAVAELVAPGRAAPPGGELVARLTGVARNELYRRTL